MKIIKEMYRHIDNGGVNVLILDKDIEEGIVLKIYAEYFGYPTIQTELRIDALGSDWLRELGNMLIESATELDKIDFNSRYDK